MDEFKLILVFAGFLMAEVLLVRRICCPPPPPFPAAPLLRGFIDKARLLMVVVFVCM